MCLVVHPGVPGDQGPSALDWMLMRGDTHWGVTVGVVFLTGAGPAPDGKYAFCAGGDIRVAVIGFRGRGSGHIKELLAIPGVRLVALCDVDQEVIDKKVAELAKKNITVKTYRDYRECCADKDVDAVTIATPNHSHVLIALTALANGKHVYVEKPGSQNPREAEMIVEASKKYDRLVQMGNQRRTWMKEAIEALHGGAIGTPRFARGFYYNTRKTVAVNEKPAPVDLDFNLWQGPVPDDAKHDIKGQRIKRCPLCARLRGNVDAAQAISKCVGSQRFDLLCVQRNRRTRRTE